MRDSFLMGQFVFTLALGVAISNVAKAQQPKLGVEVLMTPALATQHHLGVLRPDIAFTPNGVAVVGDGDQLWSVGSGGTVQIAGVRNANSFAISEQGLLVVVSGRSLLYLEPESKTLKPIFELAFAGMTIVPEDGERFFLFGPDGAKGFAVYELLPGRRVVKIVDTPQRISGVARLGDEVLIVTGGALFAVYQNTLQLLAGESGGRLRSVAVDEQKGRIFLSDGKSIFCVQRNGVVPLIGDMGGELRWQNGGLVVYNPGLRSLVRLVNLPDVALAP